MIKDITEKFKGVDFDKILTTEQAGSLGLGEAQMKQLDDYFSKINDVFTDITKTIKGDSRVGSGIHGALAAVSEMTKQANALNAALGSSNNVIDLSTKLQRVADGVGLGNKMSYTVNPAQQVQITVNLAVEINAADLEKAIIMRESSHIKKRLDWATFDHVGQKTSQNVEQSVRSNTPLVSGGK